MVVGIRQVVSRRMKKKSRIGYAPTVDDGDNDEEGKLDDSPLESDEMK